jgi:hypothetical protein
MQDDRIANRMPARLFRVVFPQVTIYSGQASLTIWQLCLAPGICRRPHNCNSTPATRSIIPLVPAWLARYIAYDFAYCSGHRHGDTQQLLNSHKRHGGRNPDTTAPQIGALFPSLSPDHVEEGRFNPLDLSFV